MSDKYMLISELDNLFCNGTFQASSVNSNKLEALYELAAVIDKIFVDSDRGYYKQVNLYCGYDAKIVFDFNYVSLKFDELEKISYMLRKLSEIKIAPINNHCIRLTLTVSGVWSYSKHNDDV